MSKDKALSESLEDYLEVILDLEQINKVARAKDIAEKMRIQRGSVTSALKILGGKGLINYEPYSFITLTAKGKKIAREITKRHTILKDFLFRVLQIEDENAEAIACKMEHAMDKESINTLVKFIDFIDNCPRTGEDWVRSFINYCSVDELDRKQCSKCMGECNMRYSNGI